jgi:ribosomal protein S18 acetylase RimI-like enzyme
VQPGAFLLIARLGDGNVGYVFGRPLSGWTVLDMGTQVGEIESLAVHADHRGQGIGRRLMDVAHHEFAAMGIETVALSVFAKNDQAIRFYESCGMRPATVTYLGRTTPPSTAVHSGHTA